LKVIQVVDPKTFLKWLKNYPLRRVKCLEYEMFKMIRGGGTIFDVQKRFTHIVNHLISLGKIFEREKLNIEILKCLDRPWQPKVTLISESKDLTTLPQPPCLVSEGNTSLR